MIWLKSVLFVFSFCLISFTYIFGVVLLDEKLSFDILDAIQMIDVISILSLFMVSIFLRYLRWHFLMVGHGIHHNLVKGFFFYVAGFAYTASPGKIGELSRIIHYRTIGTSSDIVISCFIMERFFDLVVVLLLSSVIFITFPDLQFVAFVIMLSVGAIFSFRCKSTCE